MDYQLPNEVKIVLDKFKKANYQIYIVGGSVRDLLMNKEVHDWDFTTDAKPEEILKLFPEGFYDNNFGTVGISQLSVLSNQLSDKSQSVVSLSETEKQTTEKPNSENRKQKTDNQVFEITTMRKEGEYQDFRHPEKVEWTNKIEEDLKRRDFTMNAIALGIPHVIAIRQLAEKQSQNQIASSPSADAQGPRNDKLELIDPFNGQVDIKNKIIKAVGEPDKRFKEDALRLLRAIRFTAQLGFEIEKETFESIKKNADLIKEISGERIRDELFKLLGSMNPHSTGSGQAYIGIEKLREAGILKIILPEVESCFGIMQEGPKHARTYDIGEHSLLTLKNTPSNDPLVRLAALIHDTGKVKTVKIAEDGNVTFYNHDLVGGGVAKRVADRLKLSKKQADKLFRLVRWHLFTVDENQTDSAIRRFIKNVGLENIEDMMALRVGDRLGGGTQNPTSWRMDLFEKRIKEVLKKPFSISDLKVNGKDVMETLNIPPSPKVGEVLQKLFEEVLEDSSKNNKEYLLSRIKNLE
ncbi:MAG: CCA tRNA nucleotidyltransferase [Candidatus Daviesbacteria bacterium]|nr:CCA tRNA nucleotidyltransferase [Candidatus Daviesbacteria bacterium]